MYFGRLAVEKEKSIKKGSRFMLIRRLQEEIKPNLIEKYFWKFQNNWKNLLTNNPKCDIIYTQRKER